MRAPSPPLNADPLTARLRRTLRGALGTAAAFSAIASLLQLTVPLYMMQVFDRVLGARSLDTLLWLTVVALAALALLGVLEGARARIMGRAALWLEERLAPDAFRRLLEARLRGSLQGVEALRDLATCRNWFGGPGPLTLFDAPWVPVYIAVIFLLHPLLGTVALAGAVLLVALAFAGEMLVAPLHRQASEKAVAAARRADLLSRNAEVVDALGMAEAALARWQGLASGTVPLEDRAGRVGALLLGIGRFARMAIQVTVLGLGAYLVLRHELTAGASIAASVLVGRALAPVEQAIGGWRGLAQARAAWCRLRGLLEADPLRPLAHALPAPAGRIEVERLVHAVDGRREPVLAGLGFVIEPGESVALVGASGAGKSTLARLLIGMGAPIAGSVRLDGAEIFAWPRHDLGRHLGYLPQTVELFDGTVFDNIARLGAADPEAVHAAARLAGCHEMILHLPQGYETEVGEGGRNLSGGQRQLVGLARALYGTPRLVVLDEPDSSLDAGGEARLLRMLARLKAMGSTVVLISHRPSVLKGVDKILVLDAGRIEAFGPRAEVLSRLVRPRPAATTNPTNAAPLAIGDVS